MMYKFAGAKKSFMREVIWNGPFHFLNMIVKGAGARVSARYLAARIRFLNRWTKSLLELNYRCEA